jgi:hypothetical protein
MENLEMQESMADFSEELIDLKNLKSEIMDTEQPETTHENYANVQPEKKTFR